MLGERPTATASSGRFAKAIDCRPLGFADGAQAVNYITKHDVEGDRHERLFNFLRLHGRQRADREKRIKLAFACLLTAVGIPMMLAGEEFADQHDLFDAEGTSPRTAASRSIP